MEENRAAAIEATLDYTDRDKSHAARALGLEEKTLYRSLSNNNAERKRVAEQRMIGHWSFSMSLCHFSH
jgi:DNA-binding NtrC family response regulator